jgi:hypothetical protein
MKNMGIIRLKLVGRPLAWLSLAVRALAYGAWDVLDAATFTTTCSTRRGRARSSSEPRAARAQGPGRPRARRRGRCAGGRRASEPGIRSGVERAAQRRARSLTTSVVHIPRSGPTVAEPRAGVLLLAYEIRLSALPVEPAGSRPPGLLGGGGRGPARAARRSRGHRLPERSRTRRRSHELRRLLARAHLRHARSLSSEAWHAKPAGRRDRLRVFGAERIMSGRSAVEGYAWLSSRYRRTPAGGDSLCEGQPVGRSSCPLRPSHTGASGPGVAGRGRGFLSLSSRRRGPTGHSEQAPVLVLSVPRKRKATSTTKGRGGDERTVKVRCGERGSRAGAHRDARGQQVECSTISNRPSRFSGLLDGQRHVFIEMAHITAFKRTGRAESLSLNDDPTGRAAPEGQEVRLIPGRRIVILTPAGEREVQVPAQSAENVASAHRCVPRTPRGKPCRGKAGGDRGGQGRRGHGQCREARSGLTAVVRLGGAC